MTKVWIYHKWGRFREWRAFDDISTLAKHKLALQVPYSKGFEKSTHVFQHLHSPDTLSQENMFKINEHQLKMVILLSCKRRCDIYVMYMCVCVCVCVCVNVVWIQQSNTQFRLAGLQESGPLPGHRPFFFAIGFRLTFASKQPFLQWALGTLPRR